MELQNLNTKFLGRKVIYYKEIDSTQLEVWRKIEKNTIENGTIILADIQTNGKRNTWKKMAYR
jgi:hypothetical protein